jgi:hypothetical protein
MPTDLSPDDLVARLFTLAAAADVSVSQLDRKKVSSLAREAAAEIGRLRRRIEGLEQRLSKGEDQCLTKIAKTTRPSNVVKK